MSQFDDLKKQAETLGVPTNSGVYKPKTEAWDQLQITEYELHKRIREEERHQREHRLWIVAVVSAGVAVCAAIAAWMPIFTAKH
ncbi:MAG TPA: hypothetical protein VK512_07175 [Xanthobacteraceae bacterium]|nr:hypothetical protein [Xanthobacteraceae bacterium]